LSSALASCATQYACKRANCQREHDFDSIAKFALESIERVGPVTAFVVPTNLDAYARGALADLRPVIELKDMPSSNEYSQLDGYFLVQVFTVDESGAEFDGKLGPLIREGHTGREDNRGTIFIMPFPLEDNIEDKHKAWASHSYKTQACDSTHVIVPAQQ